MLNKESVGSQFGYPARALSVDWRVEALAQNPEHGTDSSARSRKVAWSCCPLAAVHSGIAIRRIRPGPYSLAISAAQAESSSASAAPGRPVVLAKVLRYRQLGSGYLLLPSARSLVK